MIGPIAGTPLSALDGYARRWLFFPRLLRRFVRRNKRYLSQRAYHILDNPPETARDTYGNPAK